MTDQSDLERDALLWASFSGDEEKARELIAGGSRVRWHEDDATSALHLAVEQGHSAIVSRLLSAGGRDVLQCFDYISRTPLIIAARENRTEIATILLDAGADVNANDEARIGDTALIGAVRGGYLAMVKLLLHAGADPNIRGWMNISAVERARALPRRPEKIGERGQILDLIEKAARR